MRATPAVACGTKTCSSPSPPAARANSRHSAVMSCTTSCPPVDTRITVVFMGTCLPRGRPFHRTGLDDRVRPRAYRPGVAIVEPDDVRRTAVVPVHFDDLPHVIRLADGVGVDVQPVTH